MKLLRSCLAVSVLATFACSEAETDSRTQAETVREPVEVHVGEVRMRQRPNALTLDGTLVADEESSVTSVVSGRVVKVLVERGSQVQAGAPLIELRDVDYKLQAQTAKAQLREARARLGMSGGTPPDPSTLPDVVAARTDQELAEKELQRAQTLAEAGASTAQALESAQARALAARERYRMAVNSAQGALASIQTAQAMLQQASTAASETTVRAPFSGEIADRMISVGEFVSPQTPLVKLVRTNPLRIELAVPQQHLGDVQPGQSVSLTVDALPGRTFEATVRYISAAVRVDTRSLQVEAVVPNPEGVLRPGLFAAARLQLKGEQTVAEVPAAGVQVEAGVSRVFVIAKDTVEERVVSIAERNGDTVIVAEGLKEGEVIAIDSLDQLGDGVPVRVAASK